MLEITNEAQEKIGRLFKKNGDERSIRVFLSDTG